MHKQLVNKNLYVKTLKRLFFPKKLVVICAGYMLFGITHSSIASNELDYNSEFFALKEGEIYNASYDLIEGGDIFLTHVADDLGKPDEIRTLIERYRSGEPNASGRVLKNLKIARFVDSVMEYIDSQEIKEKSSH